MCVAEKDGVTMGSCTSAGTSGSRSRKSTCAMRFGGGMQIFTAVRGRFGFGLERRGGGVLWGREGEGCVFGWRRFCGDVRDAGKCGMRVGAV